LVQAFNAATMHTGVEAYTDNLGRLNLRSMDGRGISLKMNGPVGQGPVAIENVNGGQNLTGDGSSNYGRLSLVRTDARDVIVSGVNISSTGYNDETKVAQTTVNLRNITGVFNTDVKSAAGANYNAVIASGGADLGAGVTTLRGAMVTMDIAESAQKMLDKIRADLGSVQGQMVSTVNNITITQVNVKAAESGIREVDFAAESSEFSKLNILAQSGSYALSQANAIQQNILRLLN
ncbi:flagellin, partial [Helicobacter typhlonius]